MFTCELSVISATAGVIIFVCLFVITLSIFSITAGVAVLSNLIEDILEFVVIMAILGAGT
jgi:hypothetical protein